MVRVIQNPIYGNQRNALPKFLRIKQIEIISRMCMVFIEATLTLSTRCNITIAVNINKISNKKTLSEFKLEQFITLPYESRCQSIFG